jgi:hypothetical protein
MAMKKRVDFLTHNDDAEGSFVLSYDFDGNLYLNGNKVVTENKITFSWWVNCAAIFGGLGAFGSFVIEILKSMKYIT